MIGRNVPNVCLKTRVRDDSIEGPNPFRWEDKTSADYFDGKRVVLFSLPGCHYCEEVRSHYLAPLARDAAQRGRLVIREVDLDSARKLTDFDGSPTTQAAFAKRMKVQFAPTVLFLDAHGRQVASPLVGAGKADFYGGYLDDAIAAGVKAAAR